LGLKGVMEQFIVQNYFNNVKRCKYIFERNLPREHSFSGVRASIANKCVVSLAEINCEGKRFLILSAAWTKPHYFVINAENYNITWIEGNVVDEVNFMKMYTVVTSLSNWIHNLCRIAGYKLIVDWARYGEYIKHTEAKQKMALLSSTCV